MKAEDGGNRLAGRYLLLEALGSGGMGTVWRARDETLGREVAVKELRFDAEYDDALREEARTRAVREAQAAARLRHPGIITVHDAFLEDGRPWIVMQLLDGASLDKVLERQGPLPPERVAGIGAEVLAALEAAHAEGVLHRDIKPANIFLTANGRAVLTDFGIATVEGQATITRSGMLVGSPGHIAPERLRGEKAGPQSDLWSLAGTLYRLVEGRAPFPGDSHVAVLAAVLTGDPVPPVRAGGLGPLLVHMLARDPLARPDPSVVRRALERAAAGEATGEIALPAAPPPRAPFEAPTAPAPVRKAGRNPGLLLAGAAVATAALALTATVVVVMDERSPAVVTGGTPTPSGTSTPTAPPAPAVPGNEARFTVPVDFCSLVPVERVREIIPNYPRAEGKPSGDSGDAACSWDAPGSGVSVEVESGSEGRDPWSGTSPSQAGDVYRFWLRARTDGSDKIIWHYEGIGGERMTSGPSTKAVEVKGLGEEAFVYDVYGRLGAQMSKVYARISNLVFQVTYADVTNQKSKKKIRQNALQMARWVAEALDES
ncbi:serine/threonine-protein kinase [Actinocorallia populi]|uniref:serine/threonine-protein kinase n=1 Tax=Actinocorallia populi TaxID=2079200 RepID=UPI0013009CA1|nr:serine/threonine-protein kinase [Actinocorallia populi]